MKKCLDNNVFMYLTCNEGKSVTFEKFVKTLKNKIPKKMKTNASNFYLVYLPRVS